VLGGIALRHELYESGCSYGIRSTARQHGLATWALGRIPDEARGLGLTRMLTICEVGDLAAVKTIEPHGGVLEDVRDTRPGQRAPGRRMSNQGHHGRLHLERSSP
jgi:predicted acetyltransferase